MRRFMLSLMVFFLWITLFLLIFSTDAQAFCTFRLWGGAIHENISREGLAEFGISKAGFKRIDAGNTSQDTPGSPSYTDPSHHYLDNELAKSSGYIEEQFEFIINITDRVPEDEVIWRYVLYAFGQLLHTAQDFYAHTNYLEMQLRNNPSLSPREVPLIEWEKLADRPQTRQGLKAGYFYAYDVVVNEGTLPRSVVVNYCMEGSGLSFASCSEYDSSRKTFQSYIDYATDDRFDLLHYDINKDGPGSNAGKMIVPSTNISLYSYAYNLAVRQTTEMWNELERRVRNQYPAKAEKIIRILRNGISDTQAGTTSTIDTMCQFSVKEVNVPSRFLSTEKGDSN